MADPTPRPANYVFLPWVRQGAASAIQTPDSLSADQAGVISVTATLQVNTEPIEQQVRLYGPGDVIGIDPQQVVRTEPRHLATNFEPNYFPAIEFDRPDFPWLFTPAKADPTGKLRPWLCLVVVRKQQGVTLRTDRNLPLPVLDIIEPAEPGRELPDLADSWAWAHVQVTGRASDGTVLAKALAGDPALTVSRLLCPRRLDPLTEYLACVVPTFELGRLAGLGLKITPADEQPSSSSPSGLGLKPAWDSGAQPSTPVTLPVYFHWEFRTGVGGDFESLAQRLLEPHPIPAHVGKRPINISQPGFEIIPALPLDTTLELEGALRIPTPVPAPNPPPVDWPEGMQARFQNALKPLLDAQPQAMPEDGNDPLLAPPIYGGWQAARHTVNISPVDQTWLDELNLDPRNRAIAALGTQIVQTQQEQLMAAAWEQLGEIKRVNQIQRQAQLARAVNGVYHAKHFTPFSEETLLKVVAPAQSRVVVAATVDTPMLLSRTIAQSAIPDRAISAPLRRLTSPRGVISARFQPAGAPPISIVAKLNTSTSIVLLQRQEAGLVTINQVSHPIPELGQAISFERISRALTRTPPLSRFKISAEGEDPTLLTQFPNGQDGSDAVAFRQAAKAHQEYLVQRALLLPPSAPIQLLDLHGTQDQLLQNLNPEKTIMARVQASLSATPRSHLFERAANPALLGDPLEPFLDAPNFPQPMYEALRDLSQDFLFPGLEHVPPDMAVLLETNPKFVESFLVGLNAEMSRELLWRNYPTDQRGTYFHQFWDTSASNDQARDIAMITEWRNRKLGQNVNTGEQLVLLIRSELLRQYPNSVIYAVPAVKRGTQIDLSPKLEDESHPLFRGTLKPDITFLGFALTHAAAITDLGWFFVIQQQPTEPRFGLDAADFVEALPDLATWNHLSWRHLANTEAELKALSHASVKTVLPVIKNVEWGKNSAHQAYITLQRPVRIAIHARDLIPRQG